MTNLLLYSLSLKVCAPKNFNSLHSLPPPQPPPPQSCILLQLTKPSLYPFLKTSEISCLGQKYMQLLSWCSLVWKGVWLINIDYNQPSASKNWSPRFLIWMPLFLVSLFLWLSNERHRDGKLTHFLNIPAICRHPCERCQWSFWSRFITCGMAIC